MSGADENKKAEGESKRLCEVWQQKGRHVIFRSHKERVSHRETLERVASLHASQAHHNGRLLAVVRRQRGQC